MELTQQCFNFSTDIFVSESEMLASSWGLQEGASCDRGPALGAGAEPGMVMPGPQGSCLLRGLRGFACDHVGNSTPSCPRLRTIASCGLTESN